MLLDYSGGADIITRILIRGKQEGQTQRRSYDDGSKSLE